MKERHIYFIGDEVRAILGGRKTMTRRIVKAKQIAYIDKYQGFRELDNAKVCPYGKPGDRLWVRETWALWDGGEHARRGGEGVSFRADCLNRQGEEDRDSIRCRTDFGVKWRPSIFMPRWASRITLEIANIRVERLQDIGEADAEAEGLQYPHADEDQDDAPGAAQSRSYRQSFKDLWQEINGKRASWESNPWVWVIEFKRAEGEK